jgi:7-cyano-7-deazaguanine synthase in queuosine biosynthesis
MKIDIVVEQPEYTTQNEIIIRLAASNGTNGNVRIDFSTLVHFASKRPDVTLDLFIISTCVYGVDRLIKRKVNSVDGWSRDMKVTFLVSNPSKWKTTKSELETVLSFLTGDYWEVDFSKSSLSIPQTVTNNLFAENYSQVNLFSGGLDSLIGAIDTLANKSKAKVLFVSHYDPQMHGPKSDQERLIHKLEEKYSERFSHIPSVKVFLEQSNDSKETTLRSRSLLFIGIALLVAKAKGIDIFVPENGTVSLNYPLSPSRRSSCSTRTTHPTLISFIRDLWKHLDIYSSITNPYEFDTKGEMVNNCKNQSLLKEIVGLSNSCGKRGHRAHWDKKDATHCGTCMPCIYRRASLSGVNDSTEYGSSLNSLYPFETKKGQDAGACLEFLRKSFTEQDIKQELLVNGLREISNITKYINVVERTRAELKHWIRKVGNKQVKKKAGIQ